MDRREGLTPSKDGELILLPKSEATKEYTPSKRVDYSKNKMDTNQNLSVCPWRQINLCV